MLNVLAVEPGACLLGYSAQKKTVPPHLSLHLFRLSSMGRYTHGGYDANDHQSSSLLPGINLVLRLGFSLLVESGHQFISQSIIQTWRKPRPTCVSPSTAFAF